MKPYLRSKGGGYSVKVKNIFGSSLIGYWPLSEAAGATAYDRSGHGFNGTYTGLTLGQPGIGDGSTSVYSDGVHNDRVDIFSAGLAAAFNGKEGTISFWVKAADPTFWQNAGIKPKLTRLIVDANTYLNVSKEANYLFAYYRPNADGSTASYNLKKMSGWVHFAFTWSYSSNQEYVYINGNRMWGRTVPAEWAGVLTAAIIGNTESYTFNGYYAHYALGNTPLTMAQIRQLARSNWQGFGGVAILFDDALVNAYSNGMLYMISKGLKGTVYAVTDLIGTAGNMTSANLQNVDASGFIVANHTKDHTVLTGLTEAQQEAEMTGAITALSGWGLTKGNYHLAFPGGGSNADTVTAMTNVGILTGRNATDTAAGFDILSVDPYKLFLRRGVQSTDTLDAVKAYINSIVSDGRYGILLFHDVVNAGPTTWQWLTSNFQALIDWIVDNGIPCKTIPDIYNNL